MKEFRRWRYDELKKKWPKKLREKEQSDLSKEKQKQYHKLNVLIKIKEQMDYLNKQGFKEIGNTKRIHLNDEKQKQELKKYGDLYRIILELKNSKNTKEEIEQYPRRFRFVHILDRRGLGKDNQDELIFCQARRDCCKFPPADKNCDDLWYFNSSKTCLIPQDDTKDCQNKPSLANDVINTNHAMNCGMLTLSFHVQSEDEIRCYIYLGAAMIRFAAEDLKTYLPAFFEDTSGDLEAYLNSTDLTDLIKNIDKKLIDLRFDAFYRKNKSDEHMLKEDIRRKLKVNIEAKIKTKIKHVRDQQIQLQTYSDLYARDYIAHYFLINKIKQNILNDRLQKMKK
eukprot:541938_1